MVTQEQRTIMREIEAYVANEHPMTAVRPTCCADGTVSVQVLGEETECDCAVRELAARLNLGDAGVTADGRVYAATDHGVAVWTLHRTGVR